MVQTNKLEYSQKNCPSIASSQNKILPLLLSPRKYHLPEMLSPEWKVTLKVYNRSHDPGLVRARL